MALTFEDYRDKILVGLGAVIVTFMTILTTNAWFLRSDLSILTGKIENMPNRSEIAQIATSQGPYSYDKERLNDKINNLTLAHAELKTDLKTELEKSWQYQRTFETKAYEAFSALQVKLETLATQFTMWRELEEKRIKESGGYSPKERTYNAEETTPPDIIHKQGAGK